MSRRKKNKKALRVKGVLYLDEDPKVLNAPKKSKRTKKRKSTRRSEPIPVYLDYWQRFQKEILAGAGVVLLGVSGLIYALSGSSRGSVEGNYSNGPVSISRSDSRITSSTSWERATYVFDSDLQVNEGSVLEIEAGSTLKFKDGKGIESKGIIRAVGFENELINFIPESSKWRGIKLEGSGASDSVFEHCVIRDTDGIYAMSASARELGLDLRDPKSRKEFEKIKKNGLPSGIYVRDANPTFRYCIIENNRSKWEGAGMRLINFNGLVENCLFQENETEGNYGGGLCLKGLCVTTRILGNTFFKNKAAGRGGGLATFLNTKNEVEIIGNAFSGNTAPYKQYKHMYIAQNIWGDTFMDWPVKHRRDNKFD